MSTRNAPPVGERILARSERDGSGCLVWLGYAMPNGYGRIGRDGDTVLVHRAAYEAFVGPIPEGMTVDHLCGRRDCVDVQHMEVVDRGENTRRGVARREATRAANGMAGLCRRGHPLRWIASGRNYCPTCFQAARKRRRGTGGDPS